MDGASELLPGRDLDFNPDLTRKKDAEKRAFKASQAVSFTEGACNRVTTDRKLQFLLAVLLASTGGDGAERVARRQRPRLHG